MGMGLVFWFLLGLAVSVPLPWVSSRLARGRGWGGWMRFTALALAGVVSWVATMLLYQLTRPESPPTQHAQLAVGDALTGILLGVTHVVVVVALLVTNRSRT